MSQNYSFNNNKYVTSGIRTGLPVDLQYYLWQLINKRVEDHGDEVDYLQVFTIEPTETDEILVCHKQEEPWIEDEYRYSPSESVECCKIFVIDDISHSTMLFSHEY